LTSVSPPNPGPGWRLLLGAEIIDAADEWTATPTYVGWGRVRSGDVGRTVKDARTASNFNGARLYYRRAVQHLTLCGCGKHDIDSAGDPYVQHNSWVEEQTDGKANL